MRDVRGPGRPGRRRGTDGRSGGGNNRGGGGGYPPDDNNDNKLEYRDWRRFRLHNEGRRRIAVNEPERFSLGGMDQRCVHCGALCFVGEEFSCCMGGNVTIPALPPLPNQLAALYTLDNAHSRNFRNHICLYNNMFAFASMNYDLLCLQEIATLYLESVAKLSIELDHYILLETEICHMARYIYMTVTRQSNRG